MKKIISLLAVAGLVLTASAQKTEKQVATLQHGDKTTVFYGIDAFKQAYDAAADTLDVITLSSGEFNVPSISKSIAIYGAGFENDTVTGTPRTYLNGGLSLRPADAQDEDGNTIKGGKHVNGVHIEGVYVNGNIRADNNNDVPIHNLSVVKCRIQTLAFHVNSYDCAIRQSYLDGYIGAYLYGSDSKKKTSNLYISNNYIANKASSTTYVAFYNFDSSSTIYIDHCVMRNNSMLGAFRYTNNIIYSGSLSTGAEGSNNIFIGVGGTSSSVDGSWYGMNNQGVWAAEGEDGSYAENKDFALKYPAKFVGTDGTEIGLHGGVYAWNKIPSIPRITECTIDTENVSNGTLKVSIKAEAQTKE